MEMREEPGLVRPAAWKETVVDGLKLAPPRRVPSKVKSKTLIVAKSMVMKRPVNGREM